MINSNSNIIINENCYINYLYVDYFYDYNNNEIITKNAAIILFNYNLKTSEIGFLKLKDNTIILYNTFENKMLFKNKQNVFFFVKALSISFKELKPQFKLLNIINDNYNILKLYKLYNTFK